RLCELLDNAGRGWRKLAEMAGVEKRFKCSTEELEMCSLKVLEPHGSPTQCLLQLLAERDCTLKYLLGCLERMGHTQACQVLSSAVQDMIRITVQPESQAVMEGVRVSLTCWATGPPGLAYQWFCGKQEVPGATSPELVIDTAAPPGQAEWYICRVNCGAAFAFSRWAHVQVEKSSSPSSASSYCPTMVGLQILRQPRPCHLAEGDTLVLECRAIGNPPPQYQWFRNRRPVEGAQAPRLQVKLVTTAERGSYSCRVFNLFHEVWSREVDVEIGEGPRQTSMAPRPACPGSALPPPPPSPIPAATDKVALLIGNMHYLHHKQLKAPMVDVHALSALLRQLDFKVVSLLDLCKAEMQMAVNEFLLLLDKGVYGLLYYAGHGYENFGNSFMVPIDAPSAYTSAHCLCVQRVLQSMQQRRTGLNIFLLDMCRKRNLNDDIIPQVGALQVTANIVFGYATWVPSSPSPGTGSGAESPSLVLSGGRGPAPHHGAAPFAPVSLPTPCIGSPRLVLELGFAAEFSNIMIIYTRVVATPGDIAKCEAKLTDIPEELDVDLKCTNKESPEEVGSPLAPAWSLGCPSSCLYSRLCGLQKLRQELAFTVCLQYRYRGMDDFVEERRTVSVGKPLIAKLNLR
ncbi:MALT1 protein, partial [Chroicocephalus maculipennis]|nr:MALT1 protein [Chroicocephalus maculipennis]